MEDVSNRRKNQQRDGIQHKDRAKRHRQLVLVRFQNRRNRRNRTPPADGRARGNQERRIAPNFEQSAERQTQNQRERNSQRGVEKAAAPRPQHLVQIHPKAQRHDGTLQKNAGDAAALADIRMRETKAK